MRTFLCLALFLLAAAACEEPTVLDLRQTPSVVVIEGLLTDKTGSQVVTVSRSADFYASGKTPRITDATVTVADDQGNEIVFMHNPANHPDSMGVYVPSPGFAGQLGRTYTLRVVAAGQRYEATDVLHPVIPIDSLAYQEDEGEREDPKDPGKYFEVLMFAREPQDEKNFYLFKFYRNDSLQHYNPTDVYFSSDDLLAERIDGVPSPVFYGKGDHARVEIYSLSRRGYVFYNDLFLILNNDGGGMFGPIPSSPRTNLSNGALGFFQVSAVNEKEILVE